jgi:hypothetical protein
MQKHEAWKALGVPSFEILCTTRLRMSADEVAAVLKGDLILRKKGYQP